MVEKTKTDEEINKKNKKKNVVNETIKKDNDFAKVYLKSVKVSPKKLNIIISPIRGLKCRKSFKLFIFFSETYFLSNKKSTSICNCERRK